jgi:hypothetical protein
MSDSSSLIPTLLLGAAFGLALGIALSHYRTRQLERERRIRNHVFPRSMLEKVREAQPHLQLRDLFLVARADAKLAIVGGLHHRSEDFEPRRGKHDGGGGTDASGSGVPPAKGSGHDADPGGDGGGCAGGD